MLLFTTNENNATFSVKVDEKEVGETLIPGKPYDKKSSQVFTSKPAVFEMDGKNAWLDISSQGFCGKVNKIEMYYYQCQGRLFAVFIFISTK